LMTGEGIQQEVTERKPTRKGRRPEFAWSSVGIPLETLTYCILLYIIGDLLISR
jgi:hypothetical protein